MDSIRWFWAVIAAGYVPAISPPLTKDVDQRKKYLSHLFGLLRAPLVLTTRSLAPDFNGQKGFHAHTVENLQLQGGPHPYTETPKSSLPPSGSLKEPNELAVLMLTSGSSGNPKAVCLRHGQIIHAIKGKIASNHTQQGDRFLNYIGLDHVANLTEIHLHAMYLGAEQTHVPGSRIMKEPLSILQLIHEYRISYCFATKSLLVGLVRSLKDDVPHELDLTCLKALITGGDAIPIATCTSLIEKVRSYGVMENFIRPGFGMTETCAGCTYSKACPEYEQNCSLRYASRGNPTQAISIDDNATLEVPSGVKGSLQVRGSAVFSEYFNDARTTAQSFTTDGWFKTGDEAIIYPDDHLVIVGRAHESITIKGKEFAPLDFETAIEEADIPGITPSYTVALVLQHLTESMCIVYVPEPGYGDAQAGVEIADEISKVCVKLSGVVPWDILAVDEASLPKSSLGKISRVKTSNAYQRGAFSRFRGSTAV